MTALLYWRVISAPPWARIAGARRKLNEVFPASEGVARFLAQQGVLRQCAPDGGPIGSGSIGGTGQADFSNPDNSGLAPLI